MSEIVYSAHAHTVGGRAGVAKTDDGMLDVKLAYPKALGGDGNGTNPEELFAAGYGACFTGALGLMARNAGVKLGEHSVDVTIDLPTPEACKAILIDTLDRLIRVYPKLVSLRNAPQIAKAAHLAVGLDARRIRKAVLSALAHNKQIASHPESLSADAVLAAVQQAQAERTSMEKTR